MFEQFLRSYIEAIFFTNPELGQAKFSDESKKQIEIDCHNFWKAYFDIIAHNPQQAGHDFWLTRNHHGAGFWDGDWPEPIATILTRASIHTFGEINLYVGDDGFIYA